jgi:hypothetical protein
MPVQFAMRGAPRCPHFAHRDANRAPQPLWSVSPDTPDFLRVASERKMTA